jgi:hypothetical protein
MAEPVKWEGEERPVQVLAEPVTLEGNPERAQGCPGCRAVRSRKRQQPA